MFALAGFASGYVLNAPATSVLTRASAMSMQLPRVPGEGDPFGDGIRQGEGSFQPRGISDASVLAPQYIETEDEPWHSTAKQTVSISKGQLSGALGAQLPFLGPEEQLDTALLTAKNGGDVDNLIKKCISAGGRDGSPAVKAAKAFKAALGKDDGKTPKYKPVFGAPGGATPGWADQGAGRKIATVHDNSV